MIWKIQFRQYHCTLVSSPLVLDDGDGGAKMVDGCNMGDDAFDVDTADDATVFAVACD